ncbi:MAG: hypothetical protein JGK24_17715 [Microcoleus sp. PH2017_29_MFU_D_A]|jgi:hypothetical protein|uniref:hypothetical protein n=1 Tax=unclassified Microcoleus TaxID=2642155 RepID=UPI001E17D4C0|nr:MULTISPECIES: hypothetical protein [unclassified Microcoleus]MCC3417807.1 hypothetical protein [Microcoleus sp. PH2017_07_MST_O_A]MCC3431097.1 hypothetical protein [Microcoleus sp. PH2017_04_SCI_O_A]MCC3441519.1 hypothetical protein [Microcoleus sp. PH2017_03_ELD_O_A]MCC3464798.1 hypothetical protein [Microcoleus sp. PH2017_06_SFM_O_A]MCC3501850.1 hypothetical protein [Microcoleus sp. PH2017_19_SFW_U_A]MCC3507956.1 hypothetical protein [Microcoleus sp. PH2017_17_BER_D_A]TAE09265.1 MAG: hy
MTTTFSRLELQKIAEDHRLFLWSILALIVINLFHVSLQNQAINLQPIRLLAHFAATGFRIFALYKLVRSLKLSAWIIWLIVGSLVPILSLLVHDKAMKAMKSAGIKVGFMGVDPSSI